MAKDVKAFLKTKRKKPQYRPVCERIKDYKEVVQLRTEEKCVEQASRCMDCGVPFCHWACPLGNYIPEWNDAVLNGQWEKAFYLLNETNNLPEITGRVCPVPCEFSCVLGVNDDPVTIRENELNIIEYGFKHGLIKANPPKVRTGKKVAIVGSGPAGLAAASQLNKAGHTVTVYERDEAIGGILRFGIPDFKLEKWILQRRIELLEEEGIEFKTGISVGGDLKKKDLIEQFDAVCLTMGSRVPRDVKIPGRDLGGIHFAMEYLSQSNRRIKGEKFQEHELIDAKDKKVVIIGGGDTGADCVGTANRQGASCIVQIELLERPSERRSDEYPWPSYPLLLKTSTSHEEGADRKWSILTKRFLGKDGRVARLECVHVEFSKPKGASCPVMKEVPKSTFTIDADLVILAVGFLSPEKEGLVNDLAVALDKRGNIKTDETYMTSLKGVFSAGDAHRGQSLIVWAISEGRRAAHYIDRYLMGVSVLPNF